MSCLLAAGMTTIAIGSIISALAPGFATLMVAETLLGAGLAATTTGAMAAVAAWAVPAEPPHVLAWALLGQPASWVIGMPIVGAVAELSWRLAWVALPLTAAVTAGAGVLHRSRHEPESARPSGAMVGPSAWRRPDVRIWAASDILAGGAWAAVLAYLGARLQQADHLSASATGFILGATAAAYFPGSLIARAAVARRPRAVVVTCTSAALAGVIALGATHDAPLASIVIIVALMTAQGARSLASSALGLAAAPDRAAEIGGIRAAALQFGALGGVAIGGLALSTGGWRSWGLGLASLYAISLVPHGVAVVRTNAAKNTTLPVPAPL